jgi:hypothetical protein
VGATSGSGSAGSVPVVGAGRVVFQAAAPFIVLQVAGPPKDLRFPVPDATRLKLSPAHVTVKVLAVVYGEHAPVLAMRVAARAGRKGRALQYARVALTPSTLEPVEVAAGSTELVCTGTHDGNDSGLPVTMLVLQCSPVAQAAPSAQRGASAAPEAGRGRTHRASSSVARAGARRTREAAFSAVAAGAPATPAKAAAVAASGAGASAVTGANHYADVDVDTIAALGDIAASMAGAGAGAGAGALYSPDDDDGDGYSAHTLGVGLVQGHGAAALAGSSARACPCSAAFARVRACAVRQLSTLLLNLARRSQAQTSCGI